MVISKKYIFLIFLIILFITLSRIFFQEKTPYEWDSINLMLALDHFDPAQDRPHFLGYIGYVFSGKLLNYVVKNPHFSLLSLNLLTQILLLWGMWKLGKRLFDEKIAFTGVLLTVFNPIVWFYSEIVSLYLSGATIFVWLNLLFLNNENENKSLKICILGLLWGLSGSIRPDVMVFLIPVVFYCLRKNLSLKLIIVLLISLLTGNLLWFIPTIIIGNLDLISYFTTLFTVSAGFSSVLIGGSVKSHGIMLLKALIWLIIGWGWALPFVRLRLKSESNSEKNRGINPQFFLLLSFLPELIFQILLHLKKPGYILLYLPNMILLGAKWMDDYFRSRDKNLSRGRHLYLSIIILLFILYFLLFPSMFPPPGNPIISNNPIIQGFMKLDCLTCNRIRQQDVYTQTWTKFISRNYDPDSTLILVQGSQYDWRRVSYQLPAFRTLQILTSIDEMPRAQLSYHNNITYGQKELVIPRQLTTILCLTEDSLFLETSILPTSIFHKQNIDLDICWYESLLPPKMMIEGLSIIKL